jgi:hypothetical protein
MSSSTRCPKAGNKKGTEKGNEGTRLRGYKERKDWEREKGNRDQKAMRSHLAAKNNRTARMG